MSIEEIIKKHGGREDLEVLAKKHGGKIDIIKTAKKYGAKRQYVDENQIVKDVLAQIPKQESVKEVIRETIIQPEKTIIQVEHIDNSAFKKTLKKQDNEIKDIKRNLSFRSSAQASYGGEITKLTQLIDDVKITNPINLDNLVYNSTLGKWINSQDTTYLTKAQADTYYYPLSTNPAGYLTSVGATPGTYNNVTVAASGLVTAGSNVAYLTGNQSISLSGAVTGSGATSISTTLATNIVGASNMKGASSTQLANGSSGNLLKSLGDGTFGWDTNSYYYSGNLQPISLTSTYVGYGSAGNVLTGSAGFTFNSTTNLLTVQKSVTISGGTAITDGLTLTGKISQTRIDAVTTATAGSANSFTTGYGKANTVNGDYASSGGSHTFGAGNGGANSGYLYDSEMEQYIGGAGNGGGYSFNCGTGGADTSGYIAGSGNGGGYSLYGGLGGACTNTVGNVSPEFAVGYGGGLIFIGGKGGQLNTSGLDNSAGGVKAGAGGACGLTGGDGGNCLDTAAQTVGRTRGVGGTGGSFSISGGGGGLAYSYTRADGGVGGGLTISGGNAGAAISYQNGAILNGGVGGGFSFRAGSGGQALTNFTGVHTGGAGGVFSFTSGNGAQSWYGTPTGGAGGAFTFQGGSGGEGKYGDTATGGAGSSLTFTGGSGGSASSATNNYGGAGGSITFTSGLGGAGATASGLHGNIIFKSSTIELGRFDNNATATTNTAKKIGSFQIAHLNAVAVDEEAVFINEEMVFLI